MTILGIETSCDETALALMETRGTDGVLEYRVIQSLIHSQAEIHSAYGGVFPALAKREHSKNLVPLLEKILGDLPHKDTGDATHPISNRKLEENITERAPKITPHINNTDQNFNSKNTFAEKFQLLKKTYGEQNADLIASLEHAHFLEHIPYIDCIAVTQGPGLEPALWVGITFAQILGEVWNIPVVPVNHMEGHVVGSLVSNDKPYGTWQELQKLKLPAVALLISGGHTELIKVTSHKYANAQVHKTQEEQEHTGNIQELESPNLCLAYFLLGQTRDDAVGEAFDKVARLLGLSYPGGPHLARLAHEAWEQKVPSPVKLPRPMINSADLDFSFSGLKTAVLYAVRDAEKKGILISNTKESNSPSEKSAHLIISKKTPEQLTQHENFKKGLAYEFEQAVTDVLDTKLRKAIEQIGAQSIIVGGGVSANHVLRNRFTKIAEQYGIPLFLPSLHIAGDNALMIALVVALHHSQGELPTNKQDIHAQGTQKISR
jgi:N6-L-threonylcarbamoyladenine synthase